MFRRLFYSNQEYLLGEMDRIAADLGGSLSPPALHRHYRLIRFLFGWEAARRAKQLIRGNKLVANRNLDLLLHYLPGLGGREAGG